MKGLLMQLGVCVCVAGGALFSYLEKQNRVTELKILLPELQKQIAVIEEENRRLAYEIDQLESPIHLMELARRPEFSHLKHPLIREIFTVPEAIASTNSPQ